MDDASLDDFATDSDAGDDGDEDTGSSVDEQSPAVETDSVAPALSTYSWSTEAAACAACGAEVEQRWRDEGGLVCGDCKEW